MGNVLVCLLLHRFVNDPILFFRLLVLWPYVDESTAVLTERERPLHPFPLQLPLGAVAAAVN